MNDVNFEHLIEHALSCTLERVDKDVSNMGGLRFGTVDESWLIKATGSPTDNIGSYFWSEFVGTMQ